MVVRSLAKMVSIYGCGRAFGYTQRQSIGAGLLLVPMAGLAIGLVHTTSSMLPELGARIAAIVLGAVAIFETIGPPLAAFALRLTGEANEPARTAPASQPEAAGEPARRSPRLAVEDDRAWRSRGQTDSRLSSPRRRSPGAAAPAGARAAAAHPARCA